MGLKVLVAPDKFKGTLTALQAAQAMERGWKRQRPDDELTVMPISDGGEGFGELISKWLGAVSQTCRTTDPAHRSLQAEWWWEAGTKTAVIEAARVNGLALLPAKKYHPFELDTSGLGAVFQAAAAIGARKCLVGIGGSATNDGGFGVARSLGCLFANAHGQRIERWTELHSLAQFKLPPTPLPFDEVTVAVDVQNPLLGPLGCSRIYGPQKGLREEDFPFAERCLGRLAEVALRELHFDASMEPGSGAAGGLGFGLRTFLQARFEAGFQLFARYAHLEERVREAQLVLTGEGSIDASTLMGKGVGELAALCRQHRVPCFGLAGMVPEPLQARERFDGLYAMVPNLISQEQATAQAADWLERLAEAAAREWHP